MSSFANSDYDSSDLSEDDGDNLPVSAWLDEEDDPEPVIIKPVVVQEPKIDFIHKPPYIVANLDLFFALCEVDDWEFEKLTDEQQEEIMKTLVVEKFHAGDKIIVEGDSGNDLFIVVASEATADFAEVEVVMLNQQLGTEVFLTRLRRGQYFGQKFFITRRATKRGATVRVPVDSTVPVAVARLTVEHFEKWEQFRNLLLVKTVPLIQILPRKERSHILQSLVVREYRDGEYIIRQGEKGEEFFIIQDGSVKVVQQRPSAEKDGVPTEVFLVTLREGHFFGEMSLVSDEPRVASVVSVRNTICFVLSKQAFQSALADESFRQALTDVLCKRKEIRKQREEKEQENTSEISSLTGGTNSVAGSVSGDSKSSTPRGTLSPTMSLRRFSSRSRQSSQYPSSNNSEVNITTTLSTKKLESGCRVINKYVVERELGKGSFGDVYLCTDQESGTQYAMKTINRPPTSSWNDEATNSIRQEIAVMKRLKHQNIVFLHEVIDDQNSRKIYLIQEYMEGGALMPDAESCDPMDVKLARKYFRDILRGVCYLHSEGIIHRDIKPQNMLLSGEGVVKIADFGAAVFTGGSVQEKVAFGGTPAFMAPELFLTNTAVDFTKHAGIDVFALGATLYYMVIGRPPWMAKNQIDLAIKIKNIELTFPVEGIDPHLKHLLKLMLAKDYRTRCNLDTIVVDDWVTFEGSEPLFEKDDFFIDAVEEYQDFNQVNKLFNNPEFAMAPPFKILLVNDSLVIRTMFHNQINNIHHTITVGAASVEHAVYVMRNATAFSQDCNFDYVFIDCPIVTHLKVHKFIKELRDTLHFQGKIICMKSNHSMVSTASNGVDKDMQNSMDNLEDLVADGYVNMIVNRPIGNRELEKLVTTSDLHQLAIENNLHNKHNANLDDKVTQEEVEHAITLTSAATTDSHDHDALDENDVMMLERVGSNMSMLSVPTSTSSEILGSTSSAKDDDIAEYDTSNNMIVPSSVGLLASSSIDTSAAVDRGSKKFLSVPAPDSISITATAGSGEASSTTNTSATVEDEYDNLQDFDNCAPSRNLPPLHHRRGHHGIDGGHRHGVRSNTTLVSNESTASMMNPIDISRMNLGGGGETKGLVRKRGFMVVPYGNQDTITMTSSAGSVGGGGSSSSSTNDPSVLFDRPLKIFSLKEEASRRERREVAMRHSKLAQQFREAKKRGEQVNPSQTLPSSKSLLHMVKQQSVHINRRSFFEKKSSRSSFGINTPGSGSRNDDASPSLISVNSSPSLKSRSSTSSEVSMRQIDAFINNSVDEMHVKIVDDNIGGVGGGLGVGGRYTHEDDSSTSSDNRMDDENDDEDILDGDSSDDDNDYDEDIVQLDGDAFDEEFAKFIPKKVESNEAQEMAEWNHIIVGADLSHKLIASSGDGSPASPSYNPAMGVKYAKHEDIVSRSYMEDRSYACVNIPGCGEDFRPVAMFAVFDGHNGDYVASHLQSQYVSVFTNTLKEVENDRSIQFFSFEARMEKVFEETNLKIDRELLERDYQRQQKTMNVKSGIQDLQTYAGSVAVVAVVVPFIPSIQSVYNIKSGVEVFISHIGDCRAVLSRDGQAIQLTEDHKPSVRSEKNRIEMAGGWVQNGRVNGGLGVSRSFGDIQFKNFSHCAGFIGDETSPKGIWGVHQQVISKPDFYHFIVDDSSYEFMILASDGLWDVFPSQDAVNFVRKRLVGDRDLNKAAQALVQKAIQKGTQDNTSVVIVAFNQ